MKKQEIIKKYAQDKYQFEQDCKKCLADALKKMNNEQGLFDILEMIQQWHNDKMRGISYSPQELRNLRLNIVESAGLDTDKMIDLADEIDGCCFEIAQNKTITREHLEQENNAIDHCSTSLRALVENIGE